MFEYVKCSHLDRIVSLQSLSLKKLQLLKESHISLNKTSDCTKNLFKGVLIKCDFSINVVRRFEETNILSIDV